MLRPQLQPVSLYEPFKSTRERMDTFYTDASTIEMSRWSEGDANERFECGDSTIFAEWYGNVPLSNRRQFTFNHLRRIGNTISGCQIRNRKSIIVTPIENGDSETADQYTRVFSWLNQKNHIYDSISKAFHKGTIIQGMGLLQVYMDYREDPISGDIKVVYRDYNCFLMDPYWKEPDLSDCNGIWVRTWMTQLEAISLLPEYEDQIMSLQYNNSQGDGKFQFMAEQYNYGMRNLYTYDEFYYKDYRKQTLLVDTKTGETEEWMGNDEEALRLFLYENPTIDKREQIIPTVKLAIAVQNKVLVDGPQPTGLDCYPFTPVFGYYKPELPYYPQRLQSVISNLRDPQYLYNRKMIIQLNMLEANINSGLKVKENSLVNPEDVYLTGEGRALFIKQEAQMSDVEQIQPPIVPPTTIQITESLGREIVNISGANEELLGSAIDDKAAILGMLRQGAALTTLQPLFNQLDTAQCILGNIILKLIQINFTPGKVKKILEGEEPTAQFYKKAFGKYHCVVEEGLNTTTQKQMQLAQMLQLREIGVQISDEDILEVAMFQGKKQIIENMKKRQEAAAQMEQSKAQADIAQIMANIELTKATAQANQGLSIERVSRVQENHALAEERKAAAKKDEEAALLDKIKAIKELESIDLTHLERLINLAQSLKPELMENTNIPEQNGSAQVDRGQTLK